MYISTLITILLILSGCHTTKRWFGSSLHEEVVAVSNQLNQEDLNELKPKILSLQLQYGTLPSTKRIYTETHNVHCYQDGALLLCFIRLVLDVAPYLSEPMELSRDLALKLQKIYLSERRNLADERQVFINLVCDHITEELPPFDKKVAYCRVLEARKTNEFYLSVGISGTLTQLASQGSGAPSSIVMMDLDCSWESATGTCVLTENKTQNVLTASPPLPEDTLSKIAELLEQHYLQHWSILGSGTKVDLPNIQRIKALVDCSYTEQQLPKNHQCRVAF